MKLDITEIRWKTLEKYKIEENNDGSITYDFSKASPEEIIEAYRLLNDDDIVEIINEVNN